MKWGKLEVSDRIVRMVIIFLFLIIMTIVSASCGGWGWPIEPPPPPPPPPTTTTTSTTTSTTSTTTIPDESKSYYELRHTGVLPEDFRDDCTGSTGMVRELCIKRQELIWQGYRGPLKASYDCRDELGIIGVDPEDLDNLVARVEGPDGLMARLDRFIVRLPQENAEHSGRSVVRKEYYRSFQNDLRAHLDEARMYDGATQLDPCRQREVYDNLQGWCEKCYAN